MSIVETCKWETGTWPVVKGDEIQSAHFEDLRKKMWLLEHPCAGNIDTTIEYGKWAGDASHFAYVDYDRNNWAGWNPDTEYHPGFPVVKYRWGSGSGQIDIFVFKGTSKGDILNVNPPVVGGKLNSLWLLGVDPNKYSHWNFNAGRPDIEADGRWIIDDHGEQEDEYGNKFWAYGLWKARQELPTHTDPYEQIPHIKSDSVKRARHKPVEKDRNDISIKLQTQSKRTFQDSYIGTPPNHTWWYHHYFPDRVSEYIRLNGEPVDSIQWGPSYIERKMNSAYQDRIQHLIEQNYGYLVKVDDFWIGSWQYWTHHGQDMSPDNDEGCANSIYDYMNGRGDWVAFGPWPTGYYYKGNSVWHDGWFWRCIADNSDCEPGVTPGWENSWIKEALYQPDYFKSDPVYVQFSDYLHHCNSSAFEKVLKDIGHYDWYWDDKFPAMPWWMYQKHYYLMTQEMADPGTGYQQDAWKRWPLPRGCWRKVWRYTMNWDKNRNQKARFGKEIDIDGKMVSMMWPSELGDPPGYDQQLVWRGFIEGTHYNSWRYQHTITQELYDRMERPVDEDDYYTRYYCVVDVEGLFRQAYRSNSSIESRIAERHDPQATDWEWVYNEHTGKWAWQKVPIFEIYHDLVNDIRDALLQLKLLRQVTTVSVTNYTAWDSRQTHYSTSLDAYTAGKAYCDAETEVIVQAGIYGNVGYVGFVAHNAGTPPYYMTTGTVTLDYQMEKAWVEVTITKDANVCFPAKAVGTLVFDVFAKATSVNEACMIGAGSFTYKPPVDYEWHRAFIGHIPISFEQVYIGSGGDPEDWVLRGTFRIVPAEPWPDKAYFNFIGPPGKDWYQETIVDIETGSAKKLAWELDFDGYDGSVFEEDPYNFVEV